MRFTDVDEDTRFLTALANAEVITAVDTYGDEKYIVYGPEVLHDCIENILNVTVDSSLGELDDLVTMVKTIRNRDVKCKLRRVCADCDLN